MIKTGKINKQFHYFSAENFNKMPGEEWSNSTYNISVQTDAFGLHWQIKTVLLLIVNYIIKI